MKAEYRLFKKWVLLEIEGLEQYPKHLVHLDLTVGELDDLIQQLLKIKRRLDDEEN